MYFSYPSYIHFIPYFLHFSACIVIIIRSRCNTFFNSFQRDVINLSPSFYRPSVFSYHLDTLTCTHTHTYIHRHPHSPPLTHPYPPPTPPHPHTSSTVIIPSPPTLICPTPPPPSSFLAYQVSLTNPSFYPTCGCFLQGRGSTALMWASQDGRTDIVLALLAATGIDVNHATVSIYPLPHHMLGVRVCIFILCWSPPCSHHDPPIDPIRDSYPPYKLLMWDIIASSPDFVPSITRRMHRDNQ